MLNVGGRNITSLSPTEILDVKCIDEGSLKSQATRDPSFCKTHPLVFFYFICPANKSATELKLVLSLSGNNTNWQKSASKNNKRIIVIMMMMMMMMMTMMITDIPCYC